MSDGQLDADHASSARLIQYCIFASITLLCYDWTLTFASECARIWTRRFTGASVLYLLAHYAAIFLRVGSVVNLLVWDLDDRACGVVNYIGDGLHILHYIAFGGFTVLHIYGVWGRDRRILMVVVPLATVAPALYLVEQVGVTPVQAGRALGCGGIYTLWNQRTLHIFDWAQPIARIITSACVIVLTWIKTFDIHKEASRLGMRTPLATLLLRDGTLYFSILLVMQVVVAATIVAASDSPKFKISEALLYFEQALTSIFLSRFTLNLRGLYFPDPDRDPPTSGAEPSESTYIQIVFRALDRIRTISSARVVGNLGATLRSTSDMGEVEAADYDDEQEEERFSVDPFREGMLS